MRCCLAVKALTLYLKINYNERGFTQPIIFERYRLPGSDAKTHFQRFTDCITLRCIYDGGRRSS